MKRLRIDYTIYSPNYSSDSGECWDYPTFRAAKRKAKALGVGSLVVRNFNREWVDGTFDDWWQSSYCWVWTGLIFRRTQSLQETKWIVDPSSWSQAALFRQFRSMRH